MVIAKAEFSLRYRPERDRAAVESRLAGQMEGTSRNLASYPRNSMT
jgi:hypothetical protein